MVLITNRQSNILQDIDSLHLFAQVVTTICKSLDEREILRNAYELLSAFDEIVTLGYRENLTISQIKTFLEMESHEERIQEIISRVRLAPLAGARHLTRRLEQGTRSYRGEEEEGQATGDAAQRSSKAWERRADTYTNRPYIQSACSSQRSRFVRCVRS
jgi:hypothetical protein